MNCERVEGLLPLHAGGDIEDERERAALGAHLEGCARCRRAAEEWSESLRLLRLDAPPEFGADFFDPIRREVMREIGTATRPVLSTLARLLSPRPLAYAASLALVCAALLFAPRLWRPPVPSRVVGDGVTASLSRRPTPVAPTPKPTPERVAREQVVKTIKREHLSRRGRSAPRQSLAAQPSSPQVAWVESPGKKTQPTGVLLASSELPGVELSIVKDEREMLKIDLRTRDPGVRIIWFSPRPNE